MELLLLFNGDLIGLTFKDEEDFYYNDYNNFFNSDEYIEYLKKEKEKNDKIKRKSELKQLNKQLDKAIKKINNQREDKTNKNLPILFSSKDIIKQKDKDIKDDKTQKEMLNSLIGLFTVKK